MEPHTFHLIDDFQLCCFAVGYDKGLGKYRTSLAVLIVCKTNERICTLWKIAIMCFYAFKERA